MADGGISALAIASLALTAVGTGVAVAGTMAQGEAQRKATDYNRQVAENNAKQQADAAAFEAEKVRERGRRLVGSQRASLGASGIDLSGSAEDVMFDSAISNELDALAAEYQGKVGSNRSMAQAGLLRMESGNIGRNTMFSVGSTLLTGASSAMGTVGDYAKTSYRPASIPAQSVEFY